VRWGRLTSIRGQLVLWYVGVLAILLVGLGIFQILTLNSYLRSSAADSLRHTASQELAVLGPCYLRNGGDLRHNALTLARLLGGHGNAVTIVTPAGKALAVLGSGQSADGQLLHLSGSTVGQLIGRAASTAPAADIRVATCPRPLVRPRSRQRHLVSPPLEWASSLVSGGNFLLVAVPLGPAGHTVGFAILGRSMTSANATVGRVLLVFGLGAIVALLIAALIALPIINRALRPLRRVADTAEVIAGGKLEERAHLAQSRDELGRLGEAFDTMVDRLQSAMSAMAASEEAMRRFLADASHELRTPATVLRGASQVLLLREEHGRPELVTALRDMHEEAVRLAKLIDDLLTLSRLDTGQPLAPEVVEVRTFLRGFLDRYGPVWPDRLIVLDEQRLDGAVTAVDPEALRRVLTNLVDNAARYSQPDGVITITGEPAAGTVSIAVGDEGPGFNPADAERVFDRFYRSGESRSRDSGGTGLGLAIVRGLVERSGGTIVLATGPERGTTVTVTLPRLTEPAATGGRPRSRVRVGTG
jgi:two-component system OmpR family sensor kinase